MITRSRLRLGDVPASQNDENANVQEKLVGKTVNPRSRTVLSEIENLNIGELPGKISKKTDLPQQRHSQTTTLYTTRLFRKSTSHLTPQLRNCFYNFYKKRLAIRAKCLDSDPAQFAGLEFKFGLKGECKHGITECAFDYLQDAEYLTYPLVPMFLSRCNDLTPRMRYILVNWMVQVHQSYKLTPETLFLALALLDRYVYKSANQVSRQVFQLLGVTALYLASKFEEMFPPDVGDYSSITEGCFNSGDIVVCEQMILQGMDFLINIPSPLLFLRRLSGALKVDGLVHNLSKYFLELAFQEYELAHFPGNFLSAVAICLALAVVADTHVIDDIWDDKIGYLSGHTIDDIRMPLQILAKAVLRQREPSKYRAIYDKYRSDDLFQRVSAMPELESRTMRLLSGA